MASSDADVDWVERLMKMIMTTAFNGSFPSEWFKNNPGKKPSIELPVMDCSLDQVRCTVKHFLLNDDDPSQRLNVDLVLLYFRKLADTMKARLEEDWTSFGITIGKAGFDVRPLDIVNVEDYAAIKLKPEPTVAAGPEDDLWILMVLASLYYHSAFADGNEKASGTPRDVVEQWQSAGFKVSKLDPFCKANSKLTDNPSYTKMIAIFDMFLFKFPDHGLATARNLTSVSRFQGFAAYQSLFRLSKLINKDFEEIRRCIWSAPRLQEEYLRITRSGQELDQPHSYAPYFAVLQLFPISPYCEYANPCLYLFTNIVSATLNDRNARCARMPGTTVPPNVSINAFVFAYTLVYGEERIDGLPEGKDHVGWIKWFNENHASFLNIRPPKALIEKLSRAWSAFGQDRPGTIGHMLYHLKP